MMQKNLSEKELNELKFFIRAKGFSDPLVMNEILDHFACKVEELKSQEPSLHLQDAMTRAHRSFGYAGFRPLADAFEHEMKQLYRKQYRSHLKKIVLHPLFIITLITVMLAFYFYQSPIRAFAQEYIAGDEWFVALMLIIVSPKFVYLFYHVSKRQTYLVKLIEMSSGFNGIWFPYYILIIAPKSTSSVFMLAFYTLVLIFDIAFVTSKVKVLQQAEQDYYALTASI